MLHVTNGDSAATTLAETGIEGRVLAWRDVLHEGPVPDLPPAELRGVRAEFIAARGWGERDALEDDMRARDDALAAALGREPVVLWFEHDLYDQLQLIQVLARVAETDGVEAILVDRFLGALSAAELAALFPQRRPVRAAALAAAREAWAAFTAPDPARLAAFTDGALPHLDAGLARLREEYPATTDGLARSERQALVAIAARAGTPVAAFLAAQRAEEAPYCGDLQFFAMLDELASGPEPLLERDPLRLTAAGRAVLDGQADRVALRGIDRRLGGVHVDGTWRWDPERLRLTERGSAAG